MLSILPSLLILGLAAIVALLKAQRGLMVQKNDEMRNLVRILTLTTALQTLHFLEELVTGFHERFPELFGLPTMPLTFFVVFNLMWIAIWLYAIKHLTSNQIFPRFAAWFLAIAGTLNGLAHPGFALMVGGYFPGLVTSPLIGLAAVLLWFHLHRARA